jgi:CheY-like chemotaxis protein
MKHILIIDDVTTNLKCVSEILKENYRVTMVKSGKQALDFLKISVPDLILLDILMPDMDGYETLQRIKELKYCENVPVIFLTADTDEDSEDKGFQLGAVDFIRKPFEPDIMMERIEHALADVQKRGAI